MLATRLIVLRSRLVFAADPAEAKAAEQEASRELARWRERQFVRAAAAWLDARPHLGRDVFARPSLERDARVASYMQLMEACLTLLEAEEMAAPSQAEQLYQPVARVLYRIPDALARMRAHLATLAEPPPLNAFLPRVAAEAPDLELLARSAVSSTLVAALELARAEEAVLGNEDRFDTVMVSERAA